VNKLSKTKKQQIVLVVLGVFAVIAGLWYLVIQNQYTTLATVQKKTQEMKEKVAKGEILLKKSDEIEATLDTESKNLETIENGMATGDIYLWNINTINHFNSTNNTPRITFLDFQREILADVGVIPKFPYKAAIFPLKGTGYYHEVGKFIADFENNFPYIRVQNLELSPLAKAGASDAEKLNFKFEIVALIKPTQ
jgi:Tfp pilus assembly protein PilO